MIILNRREFLYTSAIGMAGLSTGLPLMAKDTVKSKVALVKTSNRQEGVVKAINLLEIPDMKG